MAKKKKKKEREIMEEFYTVAGYSPKEWFLGKPAPEHMKLIGLLDVQEHQYYCEHGSFTPAIFIKWINQKTDEIFGNMAIIPTSYNSVNVCIFVRTTPEQSFVKSMQFSTAKETDPIMKKVNRAASDLYWNGGVRNLELAQIERNPINDLFEYLGYSDWALRMLERAIIFLARKLSMENIMIQYIMEAKVNDVQKFIENWADAIAYRTVPAFIKYGPWVDYESVGTNPDSLSNLSNSDKEEDYSEEDDEYDDAIDLF